MYEVYVRDLECYKALDEDKRKAARLKGDTCFRCPDELDDAMKDLLCRHIIRRGQTHALDSMRADLWGFHILCRFLKDRHKDLKTPCELPKKELLHSLRIWLVKNGYALTGTHNRLAADTAEVKKSPAFGQLEAFYEFACGPDERPETEKDVWQIDNLGEGIRNNPVNPLKTLNFAPIVQVPLREETKQAMSTTIRYLSVATLNGQLRAMKRLSAFLAGHYPQILSALSLNREIIEDYLLYLNTEVTGKKSFRSEITSLKSLIDNIALCQDASSLQTLFVKGDATDRGRITGYRSYTDAEVGMLNEAFLSLPKQIARAIIIHQLLGNRISETLTLTQDCICKRGRYYKVRVFMVKSQRTVYKPAGEKVRLLIEKSIEETNETYGQSTYVFVNPKCPEQPMSYKTVQYHLMKLIREMDLRDENGQLYGVGTHTFRGTMGSRLTRMHYDDKTIAELLGHSSLSSVHRYRKYGSKDLADETRSVRDRKDDILQDIMKEWE